ncbi:MAG TPA: hypothetical protein VMQ93_20140 [Novosphingobium sp.]|nr:hypothetical protein [Novosphingobium sp.]
MKTPYDAALRVRQRELDEIGMAIRTEALALDELENAGRRAKAMLLNEERLAATELALSSPGWLAHMRRQGQQLGVRRAETHARIDRLRACAADALGTARGIQMAADHYRGEAARAEAAAEQAASDDLGAVAFLKARRDSGR